MQREKIIEKYAPSMENALLILHELQKNNPRTYLQVKDLVWVADYMNVPRSQIYGLATYYTMFSVKPRGRHIIRVCLSPVCQMLGSQQILDRIKRALRIDFGETTADELYTMESTECIGQCDKAPCLSIDDTVYGGTELPDIEDIVKNDPKRK